MDGAQLKRQRSSFGSMIELPQLKRTTVFQIMRDIEVAVNATYPQNMTCFVLMDDDDVRSVHFLLKAYDMELGGDVYPEYYIHLHGIFCDDYPWKSPAWYAQIDNGVMEGILCVKGFTRCNQSSANPTISLHSFFASLLAMQENFQGIGFRPYEAEYVKSKQSTLISRVEQFVGSVSEFRSATPKEDRSHVTEIETVEMFMPTDDEEDSESDTNSE